MADLVNMTGRPDADLVQKTDDKRRLRFEMFSKSELESAQKSMGHLEDLTKSAISTISAIRRGDQILQLAFADDPLAKSFIGVYRQKTGLVPDNVSKALARTDDLVGAILGVRSNQISAFGRELQDRFSTGFRIEPRDGIMTGLNEQARKQMLDRIAAAEKLLSTCGNVEGFDADRQISLSRFMYEQGRNAVLFGRFATEIMWTRGPDGKRKFHAFRPVDAGTIFFAAPREDQQDKTIRERALQALEQYYGQRLIKENVKDNKYAYYQVINNRPVQGFTHDELYLWSVYPCTDIELGGYPITPVDIAIQAITTHLNITTHNKLYFQNGRAARGMIVVQSDDVDDSYLEVIRQHFQATATGVEKSWRVPVFGIGTEDKVSWQPMEMQGGRDMEFQYLSDQNARVIMSAWQISPEELPGYQHLARGTNNMALCLSPRSMVLTADGLVKLESVLDGDEEVHTTIWDGKQWAGAKIFRTGVKSLVRTKIASGLELDTSPDHRFRVVGEDGDPIWKTQREIQIGDFVFVNAKPVPGMGEIPKYRDRELTPEIMETLGWLTGDGNFTVRFNKNTGNIKQGVLTFFYHHDKERDLWQRHAEFLSAFGINVKSVERTVDAEEKEKIKARYGFKNVASTRLTNRVYDTEFVKWLLALGFTSSTEGKTIPSFVHALPISHRQAFLRGFFSADGSVKNSRGPWIAIHDNRLRSQTRDLLMSLGIRTTQSEGVKRTVIDGTHRNFIEVPSSLSIKDRSEFWKQIGFLQPHKQCVSPDEEFRCYSAPMAVIKKYGQMAVDAGAGKLDANLYNVVTGQRGCTFSYLARALESVGLEIPSWFSDFYVEEVIDLIDTGLSEEMVDVTINNEDHAFVANGFIVHNSESSNEYKLEAARDVGIRPVLANFQDFLNNRILPLIDPVVAKYCYLKLFGLDADTPEKEATRISSEAPLHGTYDEILERVEKDPVGRQWGGEFPLNPSYQAILDKYLTVGEILEQFFGRQGAAKDPALQYIRDPFWFNYQQMLMQLQAAASQPQQPPPGSQPPQQGGGGDDGGAKEDQRLKFQKPQEPQSPIAAGADQTMQGLGKSEHQMGVNARRILVQHQKTVDNVMSAWHREAKEILSVARRAQRRKPN